MQGGLLAQSKPDAGIITVLYGVPSTKSIVGKLFVANQDPNTQAKIRIALYPEGVSLSNEHYIVYDRLVSNVFAVNRIYLDHSAKIAVRSDTGNVSFVLVGLTVAHYWHSYY